MTKEFNNLEELKPYYKKKTNTYVFKKNGDWLDVKFNFDLIINANIAAYNIAAYNIAAWDIDAHNIAAYNITTNNITASDITVWNIDAYNITARNICFYAFCIAYQNIKCYSIKWRRENHIMKALDGEIIIKGESK